MAKENKIHTRIQHKRDTAQRWELNTTPLLDGELAYDKTNKNIKIGDGKSNWNELEYLNPELIKTIDENSTDKQVPSAKCVMDYVTAQTDKKYYDNGVAQGEVFGDYETNAAIGEFTTAFGSGSTSGQKGYYMKAIDFNSRTIVLSDSSEKVMPEVMPKDDKDITTYLDTNFVSGFTKGDIISITNNAHYEYCSTINEVNGNTIIVNVLPFTNIDDAGAADVDDNIVYVPNKPLVGTVSFTSGGFAAGLNAIAGGKGAFACGRDTVAAGGGAFAAGRKTKAGYIGTATGLSTSATGDCAFTANSYTTAIGNSSAAFGAGTTASGLASFSCGSNTTASNVGSLAAGINTVSEGEASSAFGRSCTTSGKSSFVCGINSNAIGDYSFAANNFTTTQGESSTAFGSGTVSKGLASFVCGSGTTAEGAGAFAAGINTSATVDASMAFGKDTNANGLVSFVCGDHNEAIGNYSFAANNYTKTRGEASAAFGFNTRANGAKSFVTGISTTANGEVMIVGGKFNATLEDRIVVYGNGKDGTNRGDAYTLDWNGNGYYAGNIETSAIILRNNLVNTNEKFVLAMSDSEIAITSPNGVKQTLANTTLNNVSNEVFAEKVNNVLYGTSPVLKDIATGEMYKLYIENGKLAMTMIGGNE